MTAQDSSPFIGKEASDKEQYQFNRIRFFLNGEELCHDVPPGLSTLDFLNKKLHLYGTKCSCNEGDCGACTVVLASYTNGLIQYQAINSCLYPAAKLHGKHLITIEALGTPGKLHPIQKALLDFRATQCGYCTPGFVMSLFALLASCQHPDQERIKAALEGNLCRCTGYDSILKAALYLAEHVDISAILPLWCRTIELKLRAFKHPIEYHVQPSELDYLCHRYYHPGTLGELFALMQEHRQRGFKLINGGTDIMVQINIQRAEYPILIDLSGITGLDLLEVRDGEILIGANTTYSELLNSPLIGEQLPALNKTIRLLASEQIRNFATLIGNIGNASPVADSVPILLVLEARIILISDLGERILPLKDYYLGYKRTELKPEEIIKGILIPIPPREAFIHFIKAAKRKSVDISTISSAIRLESKAGIITKALMAFGGVAGMPLLSPSFSSTLTGKSLSSYPDAMDRVVGEFAPISDVRGSEEYRKKLIWNHLQAYRLMLEKGNYGEDI